MLRKYPMLSFVAVATLGVGIGLSTTVFCVVNGGLFKGLPFPDGDRIVEVSASRPSQNQPEQPISIQDLEVFRTRLTTVERIGAYGQMPVNLSDEAGRPERFPGGQLTVAAFEALGVAPILGRGFRAGDDRPGRRLADVEIAGGVVVPPGCTPGRVWYTLVDEYGIFGETKDVAAAPDGSFAFTTPVQVSRRGEDKDGRLYRFTVYAADEAGTGSSAPAAVVVRHDQRKENRITEIPAEHLQIRYRVGEGK